MALGVLVPLAYLLVACLDLREALAHRRQAKPWACALAKALAYALLSIAALAH